MTHKSNTPNPKVAAWAESMGFEYRQVAEMEDNYAWCKKFDTTNSTCVLYEPEMTFMYRQMLQSRIDELRKMKPTVHENTGKRGGQNIRGFNTATRYYQENFEQRIAELKAKLQELDDQNGLD